MPQNYKALTRTYRPQSFDDIVSQDHVSNTLKNAIKQDRISHAYMFCGPRGVGKTTMARVLARTINSIDADVDGESLNQTLNVVEIDAASNNKVEDIHRLRESIRIPPQNGRYKVFIVDEVHMLTKSAFNALLKTLEEPPAHAIFIFATTEPHKVLPTILSRVQRFDFKRISVDEIVARLKAICQKEKIDIDEESLHVIAKKADGALRDALGLMDQAIAFCGNTIRYNDLIKALNVVGDEQLFTFIDAVEKKSSDRGLQLVNDLMQSGVDIQEFLAALTEHLRNLYVALNSERMHLVDATQERKNRYKETSRAFEEEDLMRMLHMVSEAQIKIRDVQQPRVHFEILLLKLIHMNRTKELSSLIEGLNRLKKNGGIQVTNGSVSKYELASEENYSETPVELNDEENSPVVHDEGEEFSSSGRKDDAGQDQKKTSEADEDTNFAGDDHTNSGENSGDGDIESEIESEGQKKPEIDIRAEQTSDFIDHSTKEKESSDDYMFGKPTLGFAEGISSTRKMLETEQEADTLTAEPESPEKPTPLTRVEDLEEHWSNFVEEVRKSAPQLMYYQVQRVSLKDLRGTQLIVSADSEFAINMFDENQDLLSEIMKRVVGVRIRITCVAERSKKKKETQSPYERFKELQKKDPRLKSVVELFGAELDY